ncbi:MAG: sugar isomerase domain-containing protein [Candidatus Asgardarchaeia archaeon]
MKKNAALEYFERAISVLKKCMETQMEDILKAADAVAESIMEGGVVRTFGTGHSHMIAEEPCVRASSLAPVNAILVPGLKGDTYAWLSYKAERLEGYAKHIIDYYEISKKDVLIIVSNSGINAVPVEMAMEAKKRGIKTIAITSLSYSKGVPSRHSSGKKLYQIADIVIDNCCPLGEGMVDVDKVPFKVGPCSTISGIVIINSIMVQAAQRLAEKGMEPPVMMSGNLPESDEYNKKFIEKYKGKVKIY